MNYFDLHCDTLYEMYEKNVGYYENGLSVSFENAAIFDKYCRIAAIWTKHGIDDDAAFARYKMILAHANASLCGDVRFCVSYEQMEKSEKQGRIPVFLAVEGSNLLGGDISRLDELYRDGVRFLTLVWRGTSCIGGAYDTDVGLTDFGKQVVRRCAELGIIVDVSHASRKTTDEALELSEKCGAHILATHSNSFACCAHARNITDDEAVKIADLGGLIGISLAPAHLCESGDADISDIIRHIVHYISLGLSDNICIGADFDGVDKLPHGISSERDIPKIKKALAEHGIAADICEKIFYLNARNYIMKNM